MLLNTVPINRHIVRLSLLGVIALSLTLIAVRVSSYPPLLRQPGATKLLVEAAGLLLLYIPLVLWGTRRTLRPAVLQRSTILGLFAAVLQILHLPVERLSVPPRWNLAVVLLFMLTTFALWAVAGFNATRSGRSTVSSVGYAIWSAVVTMTLAMTAGIAIELFLAPIPPESMREWAEFHRSGWTDLQAFAIANTVDSASSHLLFGPIIASVVGVIGSLLARLSKPARLTLA